MAVTWMALSMWLSGLQLCVAIAHLLRLADNDPDPKSRVWVAVIALVLYSTVSALCASGLWAGLILSVVGPLGGLTAVLATGNKVDRFQIILGIPQFIGVAVAVWAIALRWGG